MIPTMIILGLVGGIIPRYRWWSIPMIGVIWSIILSVEGDPTLSVPQVWIGGFFFGAANGALGVVFTWLLVRLIQFSVELHPRGPDHELTRKSTSR